LNQTTIVKQRDLKFENVLIKKSKCSINVQSKVRKLIYIKIENKKRFIDANKEIQKKKIRDLEYVTGKVF
jgi:hypothetical protein